MKLYRADRPSISQAVDLIVEKLGSTIRVAAPLGLGKPNLMLNELYLRALADPKLQLDIYTALSLTPPNFTDALGKKFFGPFSERHWGRDYPVLRYFTDAVANKTPNNVRVHEFYMQSASALGSSHLQRHYQSVNYTHVAANILRSDVNVIVQLVSENPDPDKKLFSLSCNPDLTLDVVDLYAAEKRPLLKIGVIHPALPYLEGESEIPASFFDIIVDGREMTHQLFALPREPISKQDHLIGFHASQLVVDDGTIQVGIGSLSEAIGAALVLRHRNNPHYKSIAIELEKLIPLPSSVKIDRGLFNKGLYGLSELVTDAFMHLHRAGILKRKVVDEISGAQTFLHGAFYLGSKEFYQWLRDLTPEVMKGLRMTRVSKVNDLYDPNEAVLRKQRKNPRFFNTCMQVSMLGEAMSETLPNGKVVSGIGGQYNFVAMSQELADSRSVLMLRSTREMDGRTISNIVWTPGHVSIPRHLRDLVITEYGIADLRGKSDEETIKALLAISDSRFQTGLLEKAKANGKLAADFEIPSGHKNNTPDRLNRFCEDKNRRDAFDPFPVGSDWTKTEEKIILALQKMKADSRGSKFQILRKAVSGFRIDSALFAEELKRMDLSNPKSLRERIDQKLLLAYLNDGF